MPVIQYGLIGFPLEHSKSPEWFSKRFSELSGPERSYRLFCLKNLDHFDRFLAEYPFLAGLNVTIPYKEQILPLLTSLDSSAQETGAVNTITISRVSGRHILTGYNTDWAGFFDTIPPEMQGERALILGSGGSSKAVGYALKRAGIPFLIVSRSKTGPGIIAWEELSDEMVRSHRFIINTTPLGMFPEMNQVPPLPYQAITPDHHLYDLIYTPEMTVFLKTGREKNARTTNGLRMLHNQAARTLEIFLRHEQEARLYQASG